MFCSFFICSVIALFYGYNAFAEGNLTGGVQLGGQTQNMTIDEGLRNLGLNPYDFSSYKDNIKINEETELREFFDVRYNENYPTPVECLGITESYEFVDTSGYIDTYVYLWSPYAIDYSLFDDSIVYTDGTNCFPFLNYMSNSCFMLMLNEDKMENKTSDGEGWFYDINGFSASCDDSLFQYQDFVRPYVESADDESISKGVVRIRFRIYTKEDLKVERNYYFEKFIFTYFNPSTMEEEHSSCTPSFNAKFSAIKDDGNVDTDKEYDEEFTDTDIFQVKNKSVVMVEVENYIYNRNFFFGLNKTRVYILLRNKETGELIDNCKSMQIIYKFADDSKEEDYHTIRKDNVGSLNKFTFGNLTSKTGQFGTCTDDLLNDFESIIKPNIEGGYKYSELPQYYWAWNYNVSECQTIYVWYEVEKGTIVKGSTYANGLHTEYDDDGNCLGVFDKDGNYMSIIYK